MTYDDLGPLLDRATDLSALADDDLATLDADLISAFNELRPTATADNLADLARLADTAEAVRVEAARRITVAAETAAALDELGARIAPVMSDPEPDPEPDEGGGDDEPEEPEAEVIAEVIAEAEQIVETAPEPVTASAKPKPTDTKVVSRARLAPLSTMRGDTARAELEPARASISVAGHGDGPVTRLSLAEAIIRADKSTGRAAAGLSVNIPVATVTAAWDADRRIPRGATAAEASAFVSRVVGPEALTASGGICQPVTPYYGSEVIASRARPVRDFLTGFNAARGGITFEAPYSLSDFAAAITDHTLADDEAGSTKNCLTVVCEDIVTEYVGAVVACLQFGNFQGRFNPESVAAATELVAAAHARVAEGLLLDALRAAQNFEVVTILGGAIADVLYAIGAAAAGYRSRNRMDPGATLDVLMPAWVINMLQGDLARQPMGDPSQFGTAEATIRSYLAARGVRVGFYLDTPSTGTSQIFGAQPGGGLLDYPDKIQWGMWAPGTHLFLDGGTLDLGIVRDSTLNSTNDYQQFMETFEGHAMVGVESLWVEQDICPSGTQALPKDFSGVCGGPYIPGS